MIRIFQLLSTYSFLGLIRYLRMKCMGKELLITGSCQSCGNCCRKINLEGREGWLRSEDDFLAVVKDYPEYERFTLTGRDQQGFLQFSCAWLTDAGLCRDHENRLPLCENFPDKSLHFCGGALPPGCGYSIREVRPFSKYLEEEVKERGEQ
ncbi:MAG TPA: YkgJ family cysteine cluster protein [Desulfocapsa sulfexigens]|nr:YkgJ family cysteine cluster protein [Desulfocapsa sulfexigens]